MEEEASILPVSNMKEGRESERERCKKRVVKIHLGWVDLKALPSKFFSALQPYCPRLWVGLLSYNSRLTRIRLDCRKEWVELPSQPASQSFGHANECVVVAVYSWIVVQLAILVQICFYDPVVLVTICCWLRANRLINESNTTGWLENIWTADQSAGLEIHSEK